MFGSWARHPIGISWKPTGLERASGEQAGCWQDLVRHGESLGFDSGCRGKPLEPCGQVRACTANSPEECGDSSLPTLPKEHVRLWYSLDPGRRNQGRWHGGKGRRSSVRGVRAQSELESLRDCGSVDTWRVRAGKQKQVKFWGRVLSPQGSCSVCLHGSPQNQGEQGRPGTVRDLENRPWI